MQLEKSIHIKQIKELLNDIKMKSTLEILEESKVEEILDIADKRGIFLKGNTDLAGFKTIYALTDTPNANNCILPYEVVKETLQTLIGKPIDIDHNRKYVIGHYIDVKLEDNKIIGYGVFYKSNFKDEWEEAKELFSSNKLSTSFEIWCPQENREMHEDGTYSLKSIEFAGGAILFKEKPAFKEAKVLDLAKQRCQDLSESLVFASEELINSDVEESRLDIQADLPALNRLLNEAECPFCNNKALYDILMIDVENNQLKIKCMSCGAEVQLDINLVTKLIKEGVNPQKLQEVQTKASEKIVEEIIQDKGGQQVEDEYIIIESNLEISEEILKGFEVEDEYEASEIEEAKRLTYEEKQKLSDDDFAVVIKVKNKKTGEDRVIRKYVINDEAHVRNALARLAQEKSKENLQKLGVKLDDVLKKVLKRAEELKMTDLLLRHKEDLQRLGMPVPKMASELQVELDQALVKINEYETKNKEHEEKISVLEAKINSLIEDINKKDVNLDEKNKEIAKKDETVEFYKLNAKKIYDRRMELADFAKDMSDEELLNEDKYEKVKAQKELAYLKSSLNKDLNNGHKEENINITREIDRFAYGD